MSEENDKKQQEKTVDPPQIAPCCSRRNFLKKTGWVGFFSIFAVGMVAMGRFFSPRVLFEPPLAFKASYPGRYKVGEVNTDYQQVQNVWIVRMEEGFYALLAVCTHLGCTPVWDESKQKFKCPCHGSGFNKEGINYEGPAPRPLERVKITLAEDGQILVDKSIVFRHERSEWEKAGAILKV